MKITICDPCKNLDGKSVDADTTLRVTHSPILTLDVCAMHDKQIKSLSMVEYVRYVYQVKGIPMNYTDEEIKAKFPIQ